MERSNTFETDIANESTDDEFVLPYNNSKYVTSSNEKGERIDNQGDYLVFEGRKNQCLQSMENKGSSNSDEELGSSNKIFSAEMDSKVTDETSNMSETNISHNYSMSDDRKDTNSQNDSLAKDSQQENKTEHRRSSVIFSSKRKSNLRAREDEEFNDSGISINNSDEFNSAMKKNSVVADKEATISKTISPNKYNTFKEDEVSVGDRLRNESVAVDSMQANKIENHRKLHASKRKLSSQTEEKELDESSEKPNKRGRGKYKLRDFSKRSLPGNLTKKKLDEKRGPNKSKKGNNSQVTDEDETEDTEVEMKKKLKWETKNQVTDEDETEDTEVEMKKKLKWETKSDETESEDGSPLSKSQVAHNHKILKILNQGSLAYLRSLSRIGPKTAKMIYEYRILHGKLESIRDLENMPGWSPKFFELFLSANNIILD